jgi:glycine/D-amino acid oxidase-like deaminating enzyme
VSHVFDVAVLGGGIVGATLAGALAELELSTVLIDRGTIGGQGATRYSGGILRLFDPDEAIRDLAIDSLARTADTRIGAAFAAPWKRSGVYYVAETTSTQSAREFAAIGNARNYPMRILSRNKAAAEYPCLRQGDDGVVIVEDAGGYADVRASSRAAIGELRRTGVILENAPPRAIRQSSNAVKVEFSAGTVTARCLAMAPGSWARDICSNLPIRVRSIPMVQMHATTAAHAPLIDIAAASYFVPTGNGSISVGSRARTDATSPDLLAFDPSAIIDDARARLALMTGSDHFGQPISVICGYDGYLIDDRPAIGQIPDSSVFVALGFAGIGYKLALGAAWALGQHIVAYLRGKSAPNAERQLLAPFSPARFGKDAWLINEEWAV